MRERERERVRVRVRVRCLVPSAYEELRGVMQVAREVRLLLLTRLGLDLGEGEGEG